jgi:hypothetical protein
MLPVCALYMQMTHRHARVDLTLDVLVRVLKSTCISVNVSRVHAEGSLRYCTVGSCSLSREGITRVLPGCHKAAKVKRKLRMTKDYNTSTYCLIPVVAKNTHQMSC